MTGVAGVRMMLMMMCGVMVCTGLGLVGTQLAGM